MNSTFLASPKLILTGGFFPNKTSCIFEPKNGGNLCTYLMDTIIPINLLHLINGEAPHYL
jgi:hypothetical protein